MLKSVQMRLFLTPAEPSQNGKSRFFKIFAVRRALQQLQTMIFPFCCHPQGPTQTANNYFPKSLPPAGPYKNCNQRFFKILAARRAVQKLQTVIFKRLVLLSYGLVAPTCFIVFWPWPKSVFRGLVRHSRQFHLPTDCFNSLLVRYSLGSIKEN